MDSYLKKIIESNKKVIDTKLKNVEKIKKNNDLLLNITDEENSESSVSYPDWKGPDGNPQMFVEFEFETENCEPFKLNSMWPEGYSTFLMLVRVSCNNINIIDYFNNAYEFIEVSSANCNDLEFSVGKVQNLLDVSQYQTIGNNDLGFDINTLYIGIFPIITDNTVKFKAKWPILPNAGFTEVQFCWQEDGLGFIGGSTFECNNEKNMTYYWKGDKIPNPFLKNNLSTVNYYGEDTVNSYKEGVLDTIKGAFSLQEKNTEWNNFFNPVDLEIVPFFLTDAETSLQETSGYTGSGCTRSYIYANLNPSFIDGDGTNFSNSPYGKVEFGVKNLLENIYNTNFYDNIFDKDTTYASLCLNVMTNTDTESQTDSGNSNQFLSNAFDNFFSEDYFYGISLNTVLMLSDYISDKDIATVFFTNNKFEYYKAKYISYPLNNNNDLPPIVSIKNDDNTVTTGFLLYSGYEYKTYSTLILRLRGTNILDDETVFKCYDSPSTNQPIDQNYLTSKLGIRCYAVVNK